MSEWQDIATAPKDGTPVKLWSRLGGFEWRAHEGRWNDGWQKRWETLPNNRHVHLLLPTAWMPLPPPPAKEPT